MSDHLLIYFFKFMIQNGLVLYIVILAALCPGVASAAYNVPTEIQAPGTQPGEVGNLELPDKCDNCHGGYDRASEPAHNWRGGMMAQAARDPIFWATLAIAEQDFDGAGIYACAATRRPDGLKGAPYPPTGRH